MTSKGEGSCALNLCCFMLHRAYHALHAHPWHRHQQALEQAVWAAFLVALPFPHVSLIVQEAHGRRLLELTQVT